MPPVCQCDVFFLTACVLLDKRCNIVNKHMELVGRMAGLDKAFLGSRVALTTFSAIKVPSVDPTAPRELVGLDVHVFFIRFLSQ